MEKIRSSIANCGSIDHHMSACSAYKQSVKTVGYFLDDVDATDEDQEKYGSSTKRDVLNQTTLIFGMR